MPVVFREGGLRYFFFSNEGAPREAPHVHVKGGGRDAKIWIDPEISIAESFGFNFTRARGYHKDGHSEPGVHFEDMA